MKRAILAVIAYIAIGALATAAIVGSLTLMLAMPDILEWVAGYIGGVTTYSLFVLGVIGIVALCIDKASNRPE